MTTAALITHFRRWAGERWAAPAGTDYESLWRWTIDRPGDFYRSLWDYFTLVHDGDTTPERAGEGHRDPWFPGVRCNYAENVLSRGAPRLPAIEAISEARGRQSITYDDLRREVASVAAALTRSGVGPGSVVAGYVPNIPEAVVAFLAAASLGAVWTSCPLEFGITATLSRLEQTRPLVLFAASGYVWTGRDVNRSAELAVIVDSLPSLRVVVQIPYGPFGAIAIDRPDVTSLEYAQITCESAAPRFERVGFSDPLYVLYSSGTTGPPKAIVHGHGPMLLHHCKDLGLQLDVRRGDRILWYTSTGWMMWNFLVSALLLEATVVLVDGSPLFPRATRLWEVCEDLGVTHFGTSPSYLDRSRQGDIGSLDLTSITCIGSTGSPLSEELTRWIATALPHRPVVASISGGTDVCSILVGSAPISPVWAGEIAHSALGVHVDCVDDRGITTSGPGEMVVRNFTPAMQVSFWGDDSGERVQESYFSRFPGMWHHGDFVQRTRQGGWVISGRSDATLNRAGVRIGTGEIYDAARERFPWLDALVVHVDDGTVSGRLLMLVAPITADGEIRDIADTEAAVKETLRAALSARHVPDRVVAVGRIPYTATGKRMEVPVKRFLEGTPVELVAGPQAATSSAWLELEDVRHALTRRQGDNR